jgi:DNA modification methylase
VTATAYRTFLESKLRVARTYGEPITAAAVHSVCKPHQRDIIRWAVEGGRRAIFAKFGLGKTIMQLEIMRLTQERAGGAGLIVAPLGVRQEFRSDAREKLGFDLTFIRTTAEITGPGLYLTNYESVREGKIDVSTLTAVSLDEAGVLRGFGGTKTFREFMRLFDQTPYRFVATATPSPNQYIEIIAYAAFLGIMDVGEAKTRFFKRDSEKADHLTLYPHKEEEFWLWVNTWAVFLQRPSELGYSDEGYELPPLEVRWHSVRSGDLDAGEEYDGQARMFRDDAQGIQEAAAVKRSSLPARLAKVRELVDERPTDHVLIWHDLEDERRAIEREIPDVVSVYGSQDLEEREVSIAAFANGEVSRLAAKPVMLGSGCNLQRHCHWAIFAGVGFKFNDFIQAIHRLYRFLQPGKVIIDIIHAESETGIVKTLRAKWARHDALMERMSEIIRQYGLTTLHSHSQLERTIGVERRVEKGERFEVVNADCVEETARMGSSEVDLVLTSIPFGTQYEYTPSYNDFGHSDDDAEFFRQMDFLTPELLRVLKPGRMACVHVKDRVRPGGLEGLGFQTVSPFHAECILHYRRHGFAYMGMITVVTDVVRENNQTYRLGWTEQCKDGSRMSVGMPEYVLLFRKPPTDSSDGYADERVIKSKESYTRARWQIDAHAFWRSNGNRLLEPADLVGIPANEIYKQFRGFASSTVYDYEQHVKIGEGLENAKRLPPGFMLLPPPSTHPEVWTDVTRMRTLNGAQHAKGKEMHLCPLQFDIVDRLIARYTNPGEVVYDPFGGLMTVPYRAIQVGRIGRGVELNPGYFADGVKYLRAAEDQASVPSLFDLAPETEAA